MPTAEYDLVYLRAGMQVLQEYLLSNEIYWAIGVTPPKGEPPYPQLTLGGLLLTKARLEARPPASEAHELAGLQTSFNLIQSQWRVAFERKASREYRSRLNLWRDFLEDYRSSPESHFDRYTYEVSRRVILHLLQPYSVDLQQAEIDLVNGLDRLLHLVFIPGEFIWEKELANGFPPHVYWYLYGTLRHQ